MDSFGKRGLRFASEVVDSRFSPGVAGCMGLLAYLHEPIPSNVRTCADCDNELDCCIRRSVVL